MASPVIGMKSSQHLMLPMDKDGAEVMLRTACEGHRPWTRAALDRRDKRLRMAVVLLRGEGPEGVAVARYDCLNRGERDLVKGEDGIARCRRGDDLGRAGSGVASRLVCWPVAREARRGSVREGMRRCQWRSEPC